MTKAGAAIVVTLVVPLVLGLVGHESGSKKLQQNTNDTVSFKAEVFPIIKKYCLPCHAEESYNPSELSLDTYESLMKGGKHGAPIAPGQPEESILIKKLSPDPTFGDPMPLNVRRRKNPGQQKKLTEEEVRLIANWISQGAKNN